MENRRRDKAGWKFQRDDLAFDIIKEGEVKILILNSNNPEINRKYYVKNLSDGEVYWRFEEELLKINEKDEQNAS